MGSPERLLFDAGVFDDSFFAAYEAQLSDMNSEEQASLALAEILTIKKVDGTQKSYEQLRDETQTFFANDWVRNDEAMMNRLAVEFAMACMSHNHGAQLAQDSQLGLVFDTGVSSMSGDKHDHTDGDHDEDDDDEIDPKTGKKKKKSKWAGRWALHAH